MTSLPTSAPTGPAPLAHTKEAIPKISADTPGASPASGVFSFPSRRADFRPARHGQDFVFYPLLTRRKACFHPSYANARLRFHSRPQARFHSFASPSHTPQGVFSSFMRKRRLRFHSRPQARFHSFASPSHTPQGVFSSFMRKRTFVLSLAPPGAFSFVYSPRGAAACSIQNTERSEWVAEAGPSRFPVNGGAGFPWSIRKTKSCPCRAGRNPCSAWSISSLRSDEICRLRLQTEKPAELSFCGLCLPWQLSTLAGPIVRLPSTC